MNKIVETILGGLVVCLAIGMILLEAAIGFLIELKNWRKK